MYHQDETDISVIIPAYNREKTIERAINSVLIQNAKILEVLVVDDGSQDNTVNIIREIAQKDERVKLIIHPQNKGEAAARNTGVKAALGQWIAFLDSDDEWLPGKISAQIDVIKKYKKADNNELGAVATGYYVIDHNGQEMVHSDWTKDKPITSYNILVLGCGLSMGLNFLIKKSVYDEIGYYDERLPLLVDIDWLCRLADNFYIEKIQEPFAKYDKAPMRSGDVMLNGVNKYLEKNIQYLKSFGVLSYLKILSRCYHYIALGYLAHNERIPFIKYQTLHLLTNPFQKISNYALLFLYILRLK